ncbi:hypothetical protein HCN44_005049 [Aphidius gifuensis]|uniref:Uncharacterized protein n=1 Tax=Aphidius gifuensis TaxID=684658 RepID=A0A835CTV6_APHGI|nr:hypothetical protein HCN44_005049 [Aphidius gifuensis]
MKEANIMQLSARSHPPPPVPPRPSRQVVAEALKKSPRPPCPTRQAPPPPNTKPWTPNNNNNNKITTSTIYNPGRTIVYESSKNLNNHDYNNNSNKQLKNCNENKNLSQIKSQEFHDNSERIKVTDNHINNLQQKQHVTQSLNNNNDIEINKNSININKLNNIDIDVMIKTDFVEKNRKDVVVTNENILQQSDIKVQGTNDHTRECNMQISGDKVDTVTDGRNKENIDILNNHDVINNDNNNNIINKKLSLSINSLNNELEIIKNEKNNNIDNIDNIDNINNKLNIYETNKSIFLADKCATVVIIDEPERKIIFNEDNNDNIQHEDWLEAGVRYSSTKIMLPGDDTLADRTDENINDQKNDCDSYVENKFDLDFTSIRERIAMSSLQGLPPLPRSLSGFNINEGRRDVGEPPPPPPARSSSKTSKGIKTFMQSSSRPSPPEFRQLLQDQDDRAPSPSSEEGDDGSYAVHPPPPPRRPAPLLHHHRPPRPPRPLRLPLSDESPSSEEYGAV